MTEFICLEVNENPGRHFNFGQGGDPVCILAWSPWQRCGTQEPLLGGCYRNLGDLKPCWVDREEGSSWRGDVLGPLRLAAGFEFWYHDVLAGQPWVGDFSLP